MTTIKRSIIFLFLGSSVLMGFSQNKTYEAGMKKNLSILNSANTISEFEKAATGFDEIASSEKKDWLSYYYAGICNTLVAFGKKGKEIDAWCDKAEGQAKKADSLSKNNSEVFVLRSMISSAKIMVNQKQRAQKHGGLAGKYVVEAIKLNANNPRAYLQKARVLLNTPDAFGGGTKKAKPVLEQAIEKYKTFKPESVLHPDWGRADAEKELKKITSAKDATKAKH